MTITQSSTRLVSLVAGVAVALALIVGAFAATSPAQAASLTAAQVSSIISLLQSFGADAATIANVQASLTGGTPTTPPATGGTCYAWTRDLQQGSTGADVMALQKFLNGDAATMVAVTGAGSPGNETSTFGPATKGAVMKFQTKYNVTPIAGYFGAKSRAQAALVCGGTVVTPTGPGLSIMAAAQPANSLAPSGASRVPFTTFTLTNNTGAAVTVNSVTVQRVGLGVNQNFSGVVLLDSNGMQLGTSKTLNSNNQAALGDNFVLNAGSSMTFTVAGNIAASGTAQSGQILSLQVVGVNTSVPVNGSLPINGASHTVNTTLTLGSVSTSTSSFIPPTGASHTQNIGDTAIRFSGLKLQANSAEDVKLYSIRWRQVGSVSSGDIANVMTYVNGTSYPTSVSTDGKYFTSTFSGGILIPKGNSVDVYVQGDLVGGNAANRTVDFDIDKSTDIYFVGQTYGYGVNFTPNYTNTPWYNGDSFTINPGTATTINKANEVAAQNIATNVPNQPLGGFATNFTGESVSVQTLKISIATSSGFTGNGPITGISIVDSNGAVVAGPIDQPTTATTDSTGTTLSFSDTITFPTGRKVYTIKGKVPAGVTNGSTLTVYTAPSAWTGVTGQTSGNSIALSQTAFAMNQMTVKGATTSITVSASPTSQNIVAGIQGFVFANFQVDATQSGEDIRISSMPIRPTFTGTSPNTALSGCQIWDGATALTTGSRVQNTITSGTSNTFTFDNSLVITKGTVKTLSLSCNVSSTANSDNTYKFGIVAGESFSAAGVTSGTSITPSVVTANGGTMSLSAASLVASVDSSSPSLALAAGGTTGQTMTVVKFRPSNEALTLTKIGLTLTATAGSGNKASDLTQVYVYQGATLVGTATFTGSNTTATSTLSTPVALAKDTDTLLTIKADIADIGTSQPGTEGDLIKIDPLNAEATGASSGTTVGAGLASTGAAGVRIFNTFPTFAIDTLSSTGVADGKLMRFKVTADSHGNVGISKFAFTVSTTTITAASFGLYGYTDSSYSSPISDNVAAGGISSAGIIDALIATSTGATPTCNTTAGSACSFSGGTITLKFVTATNSVQVPAGTTRYFELRANVTGSASGASSVTTLLADSATATGTAATLKGTYNLVWSPNATSTQNITTDDDWTTGYVIPGLPSSGLTQTRSN